MAPASLRSMAIRACIRNIDNIYDVALVPPHLILPVLRKIENPQQLHEIEANSPAIADYTADLWQAFIARDIPLWQQKIVEPKNPRSWGKVYDKLVRADRRVEEAQEAQLKTAMASAMEEKGAGKTNFLAKVTKAPERHSQVMVDGVPNPRYWAAQSSKGDMKQRPKQSIMQGLKKPLHGGWTGAMRRGMHNAVPSAKLQIKQAPADMVASLAKPRPLPEKSTVATVIPPAGRLRRPLPAAPQSRTIRDVEASLNDAARAMSSDREQRLRDLTTRGARPLPAGQSPTNPMTSPPRPSTKAATSSTQNYRLPATSTSPAPTAQKRQTTSVFMPAKKKLKV